MCEPSLFFFVLFALKDRVWKACFPSIRMDRRMLLFAKDRSSGGLTIASFLIVSSHLSPTAL